MARIETDPNYSSPTFSRATAPTDLFKKEDVQNLAAAFSTHVHDAAGKGLGVSSAGLTSKIDIADWYRSTGHTSPMPAAGAGLEMFYDAPAGAGILQAYDRTALAYKPMQLMGSKVTLMVGAGSAALVLNADGTGVYNFPFTFNSNVSMGGTLAVTGVINTGVGSSINFPSGGQIYDTAGGYVTINKLSVVPGVAAFASVQLNGDMNVGAPYHINFASGGQLYDTAGGYVTATKMTVTPGPLAVADLAINGVVTTNVISNASLVAKGPAIGVAGAISYGNELGQGNGAVATLPASKGSAFGPAPGGVGWIRLNTGGTPIYIPYFV